MIFNTDNQSQTIRNLFSLSSFFILVFLVVQVIMINFLFVPQQLYLSEVEVNEQINKDFHGADTLTSIYIIDEFSECKTGDHELIDVEYENHEICICKESFYLSNCSYINKEKDDCFTVKTTLGYLSFFLPLHPIDESRGIVKKVKLCGRKIDSSKFTWMSRTPVKNMSQFKQCTLTDTYKLGLVDLFSDCPNTSKNFTCQSDSQRLCESMFIIRCVDVNDVCDLSQCGQNQIGCVSMFSSFCVQNTEQCPITDVQLIPTDSMVPQGYEEQPLAFNSEYKLIMKRSSLEDDFIYKISISLGRSFAGEAFRGFNQMDIHEFAKINQIEISLPMIYDRNKVRIYKKRHQEETNNSSSPCSLINIEEQNEKMISTYNILLNVRKWCIRLLLIKLFFDLARFIQGYKVIIEPREDVLGHLIDKWNLRFFFFGEIAILILMLTVFTKILVVSDFEYEYFQEIHENEEEYFRNCLKKLNKFNDWETASHTTFISNTSYWAFFIISLFGISKLITLVMIIYQPLQKRKQKSAQEIPNPISIKQIQLDESSIFDSENLAKIEVIQ